MSKLKKISGYISMNLRKVLSKLFYPILTQAMQEVVGGLFVKHSQLRTSLGSDPRSPLDVFVLQSSLFNSGGHQSWSYEEWRMRRISKILEIFGVDFFRGKKILELGGGLGDIGGFFASLGAEVISAEYRITNRNIASIRFRDLPNFKSVYCNAEEDFTGLTAKIGDSKFDLILVLGFLEVIENVDNVMACCMKMSDRVILETMVCDSTDPKKMLIVEMPKTINDHPPHGKSARPSPAYIEMFFEKGGWNTERHFSSDLNSNIHIYDWEHKNDDFVNKKYRHVLRRFWYFKSNKIKDSERSIESVLS